METISLPVAVAKETIDSRYRIVIVVSQRARQLMEGNGPSVPTRYRKPATIALEEFLENKLEFFTGNEAQQAQREASRLGDEEMRHLAIQAKGKEITSEVNKKLSVYVDESNVKREHQSEK